MEFDAMISDKPARTFQRRLQLYSSIVFKFVIMINIKDWTL